MSAIVAIPARLNSARFPGKVLADIHGRSMLWHVYQGVSQSKLVQDIYILTDSKKILEEVSSWGGKVLMTAAECPSGTARIASVIDQLLSDIIVNVQGDEPMITGEIIDSVVSVLENSDADVATPVYPIVNPEEITNPNLVKVIRDSRDRALYFSRSPIPYVRDLDPHEWPLVAPFWGHVGLYAYRRTSLSEYTKLPESALETAEKLEQLRLIEFGKRIITVEIPSRLFGVDTMEDLEHVKGLIKPNQ